MSIPEAVFPFILANESDDSSVAAYLDATQEGLGCSKMQAIRVLISNLNAVYTDRRRKIAQELFRDPMTKARVVRTVSRNDDTWPIDTVEITFIDGYEATISPHQNDDDWEVLRFIVGVEWLLSQPTIAPLVAQLWPNSVPPIT